jgi:hypothetical protein
MWQSLENVAKFLYLVYTTAYAVKLKGKVAPVLNKLSTTP